MKITWDNIDDFAYCSIRDMFSKRCTPKKSYKWIFGICKVCDNPFFISKYEKGMGYCSIKCRLSNPENNNFYGKHHTQESKDKMLLNMPDQTGKNNPCWRGGVEKLGLTTYITHHKKLSPYGIECRKNNENMLEIRCYKCGKWYTPTRVSVNNRVKSIKTGIGECNLYCSDECKNSCVVYGFNSPSIDPRSIVYIPKTEKQRVRSCQTNHLKQLQCDSVGYNYCEKCGDIIDVELHHTIPVGSGGEKAVSSAGHVLLCVGCHTNIHEFCK